MAFSILVLGTSAVGLIILLISYIITYLQSPLKNIPGPFLAKFTNLWRLHSHYQQRHIETQTALHAKHGPIIRLGPNLVSINDPSYIKKIYSTRDAFPKSSFYSVNDALSNGHIIQNLFSTRSIEFHTRALRPVQKLYSIQHALKLEALMDNDVRILCAELESRYMSQSSAGSTCPLSDWLSFLAWDYLGHITWSSRMGFMETGSDVSGMLATAESVMRYFSVIGQMPWLDGWLGKNPYLPAWLYKFNDFSVAAGFSVQRFMERMQKPDAKKDFLDGFLEAKRNAPELVGDQDVIGYMLVNVLGGADTLAIVMKAIFYHILKNPHVQDELVAELRQAKLTFPASYKVLEQLPYLSACILEGLRIHPVIGHVIERVVPSKGLALPDGTVLPPGTIVGLNPWLIHNNPLFGPDTSTFNPSRWLQSPTETPSAFSSRLRAMKDADMSFGNGRRACLGRPLAMVEMYKVVATLFERYEIELEDGCEWTLNKQWFVWPHGVRVRMRARQN